MDAIVIGVAIVTMLAGAIFYNPLRRKMSGVIGVGGSYVILAGVMFLVSALTGNFGTDAATSDLVVALVCSLVCLAYMVYVMIARCHTMKQRILLPVAACLIGLGFCWRFLMALFLHIPMENGKSAAADYPKTLYSPEGQEYHLIDQTDIYADYVSAGGGDSKRFIKQDGMPAGWTTDRYS